MSLLWNRLRVRVHLGTRVLAACEVRAHGRSFAVARKALFPFAPGARAPALLALREWMGSGDAASIEWVLGPSDVRYLLLPWSPELADESLRNRVASALFEQRFRENASTHAARFAKARFGQPQLAAFVCDALVAEIAMHAREARLRLGSIAPALATVWSRFGSVLTREHGVVHLVDGDRQIAVRHERGHPVDIALRPFDQQRDAPTLDAPCEPGMHRRFSSRAPAGGAASPAHVLMLNHGQGFDANADAAYAFALCGLF
ncbi:hypothetical protein H6CHR_04765 [Variovorax sp. PBL-H6]|uniref:hypothetical protein n=1 Tax=Variovorax sp. PBL-H6 TaxID=434009 RepID=UPI0013168ED7|nr:hypothetical protein [Variovorax sp. PBL-H6]VTU36681.1 hypothetical protein H6CHR_04765 [Variovorax sp. PBL-H6]